MEGKVAGKLREAAELSAAHRTVEAEDLYRAAIRTDPTVAEAYFRLGELLQCQGRLREAADIFLDSLPYIRNPRKYCQILQLTTDLRVDATVAASGGEVATLLPVTAEIELTAHCQLNCPFCRTGVDLRKKYKDIPRGLLSRDSLLRILEQIPSLHMISMYNWGEPFLHPHVIDMVRIVKEHGKYCELSTNMQLMSDELAQGLIDAGLDRLRISCDGTTQEAYEAYRRGGRLDKVIEHSRLLAEKKRAAGRITPVMIFQMVVNRFNEHQADAMLDFARDAGADMVERIGICPATPEGSQLLDHFAPSDPRFPRYTPTNALTGCRQPWRHVSIDWNGDVYTCCNPSGIKRYTMGNITEAPFEEIWNNQRYRYARRLIRTGQPEENGLALPCKDLCHGIEFEGKWFAGYASAAGDAE